MPRQYITTAIDYPNAPPHMGHVLEKVLADVCARWFRLRGDEVRFQIGTDEHGIKIQQTAEKEKLTPKQLVDGNVPLFQGLYQRLGISADAFIRTSDQKTHWPTVVALWKKLQQAGMLEKRMYVGLYCSGCERFMTKRELIDGLCPIHKRALEEVQEENWFFLMSKDGENLRKLLTETWGKDKYRIEPTFRENETLSLIDQGLDDVSFSRPRSSLSWGVPVPGDPDQVMYVWCDALTNYISGLGYFTDHEEREWWEKAEVTHVIGKDIARFHALIWPAMLKHAGVRIPDRLLIHGFLTSEGEKMSKSLGNVVAPDDVLTKYGVDALRFYLSHEISVGNDGDFSWKRFGELFDAVLRNKLGNLLNRVLVLLQKDDGLIDIPAGHDVDWASYEKAMNAFDFHRAIEQTVALMQQGNARMDSTKPWTLSGDSKRHALSILAEYLRHLSLMLLPFLPQTAQTIAQQLNVSYANSMLEKTFVIDAGMKQWSGTKGWKQVGKPEILFPPVEAA